MEIKIKIDDKAMKRVLGSLSNSAVNKVMKQGLVAAANSAKKQSVNAIAKEYFLKKKDINVNIKVRKPRGENADSSQVTIQAQPIGLDKFKIQKTPAGLLASVSKSRGPELIPSSFLAQSRKGKTIPFIRTRALNATANRYVLFPSQKATERKNGIELPINRLMADPVSDIVEPIAEQISAIASGEGEVKMIVETEKLLDKGRG